VGVAKRDITPDLSHIDPWTDVDGDNHFRPRRGDTYEDRSDTGSFSAVWLAGFSNNRPAQGVHDPLWVRALALQNNGVTVVMVTLDSIGIFHDRYIAVRKALDPALGIDHVLFSATHTHHAPDTMGIWSRRPIFSDFDHAYLDHVLAQCVEAVEEAVGRLEEAEMAAAEAWIEPEGFVRDSRDPQCVDQRICALQFVRPADGTTIATVVNWGNHPEAVTRSNPLVSSDFPHYLRLGLEAGIPHGAPGFGGMCLYFQGSLGGLMTPLGVEAPLRDGSGTVSDNTFEKAEALGYNVAQEVAEALRGPDAWRQVHPRLAVAARTILVPVAGIYKYAIMLGLVHPGYYWGGRARTEINVIRLGDVVILTCPGELYPEIVEGQVEALPGNDFELTAPIESPGLGDFMGGRMNMVINLANDEIGYIIPKSQWDRTPPFTYGREKAPYGEVNSAGPDVAPTFYREARRLLADMAAAF